MDLQQKKDELAIKLKANTEEVKRLMEESKQIIKSIKKIDKLITQANDIGN